MSLPTIVIVPAACQTYQLLASALLNANFPVAVIPLPSVGASPGLKNSDKDIAAVCKVVNSLVDDGNEVVGLLHSYGGLLGFAAIKGLGAKERLRDGKRGGVKRLIYVSSYVLMEGEALPGQCDLEKMKTYGKNFNEEAATLLVSKDAALYAFFHDTTFLFQNVALS